MEKPFMKNEDTLPIQSFETRQSWEAWLNENHQGSNGLWLKIAKKEAGIPSIDYSEALDTALCFGWIDSQKASFDEQYWLQKFTPRRPNSKWSKANCERVEALLAQGRMQPAGLRQVELARADGRWEAAYDSQSKISIPDDLQSELDRNPEAKAFFATLKGANRYAILYRIQTAKKPETRVARIKKFVEMLENKQIIYP
jgi:uncharacterized protein YdeI (YjbR/CyaY-like superfamily)